MYGDRAYNRRLKVRLQQHINTGFFLDDVAARGAQLLNNELLFPPPINNDRPYHASWQFANQMTTEQVLLDGELF